MKTVRRILLVCVSVLLIFAITATTAFACFDKWFGPKTVSYTVPDSLQQELQKVYNRYNFRIGWGLYDVSGASTREVATYQADRSYQSNCTIKAAMLLMLCKMMDAGELSLQMKLHVNVGKLHYDDFGGGSGNYTVERLLYRMIHVSNNACYEAFLRYVTRERFNAFLAGIGSGTVIKSYSYMGNCFIRDRAVEWRALYDYCHSGAKHAAHAWKLLLEAKYSPIRDGIGRPAAHKSGWHWEKGVYGTAGDCAVVQTKNGGCYLMIMFTHNNTRNKYSQALMRELAVALDHVWNDYYASLPKAARARCWADF